MRLQSFFRSRLARMGLLVPLPSTCAYALDFRVVFLRLAENPLKSPRMASPQALCHPLFYETCSETHRQPRWALVVGVSACVSSIGGESRDQASPSFACLAKSRCQRYSQPHSHRMPDIQCSAPENFAMSLLVRDLATQQWYFLTLSSWRSPEILTSLPAKVQNFRLGEFRGRL